MKKYLLGIFVVALAITGTAFMKKDVPKNIPNLKEPTPIEQTKPPEALKEDEPNGCVWFQFWGTSWDIISVKKKENYLEFTGDITWLCNNINQKVCAICVKTSNVAGTAPNRTIISTSNIYFAQYGGPSGTWYAFMPGPSDIDAFRNRN